MEIVYMNEKSPFEEESHMIVETTSQKGQHDIFNIN